ncbi:hypothetical protein L5515_015306 [Caenorhabditis briggsae]|uniref:Chromo domain-containing protein n=2 Tax=Caenorhabditis briggsae TaxID=6238 RepID=A0AAE9J802_CAEBR|nr:hypothetical protein L5515_015306 [Caenorhabditis briggsae]
MTNSISTLTQDPDEYEVEKIHCMQIEKGGGTLTKRGSASRITFLVKWADHKQKTWEPIESFEGGHRTPGEQHPLIREFLRQGTNLAKYRKMKIAIASESKHVSSVKRFIKREESIHSISNLLDVRLDENGDMEFLVESNGNFESSWQPMRHFPGGEKSNKAILDFLNLERNRRKYEDLKLEVVRIKARKLRKSGVSKISKNPKSLKKESEKPKDPEDSKINEVFDESKLENSEEQEVQEIVKFLVEKIKIEPKRRESEDSPIENLRSGDQDSDISVFKDSENSVILNSEVQSPSNLENQDPMLQNSESPEFSVSRGPEDAKGPKPIIPETQTLQNPIPPIPEVQNLSERLQNLLKTWNGFPEKQKEKYVNSVFKKVGNQMKKEDFEKPIGAFDIWKMENEARFFEKFPKKNDKEIGNLLEFEWIFKMENSIKFAYTLDSWDRVMKIEQKGEKRLGKKVFEVPTKIPKMF